MSDVIKLAQDLMRCRSVTPADDGALQILEDRLSAAGFTCHRLPFGEGDVRIENLFARIGTSGPHLCYGGHTDVVPPGPEEQWSHPPFGAEIHDGLLYGRGASDMKGSVAAFTCAAIAHVEQYGAPQKGSISLLITGDEEAEAINGSIKVLEWMDEHGHIPDVALVGEPTNPSTLGEEIKIGRRGSLTGFIEVTGKQGHVAYPQRADNPLPRLAKIADALASYEFDQGNEFFLATNLELTTIDVGNAADNVVPQSGRLTFNVRFNDQWTAQSLEAHLRDVISSVCSDYDLDTYNGSQSFMTDPGAWTKLVKDVVDEKTGRDVSLTTTGGTSDARFFARYCDVVEFGPINATIHQIDEHASVQVLEDLTKIYEEIIVRYLND